VSIDNIKNIRSADNQETVQNKVKNSSDPNEFINLLHDFVEQNKTVNGMDRSEKSFERIQNSANYSSYNQLKVNHIDRQTANSQLVEKIVNGSSDEERLAKLEQVKNRLAAGFYLRDDIIDETAGKIVDSLIK